MQKGFTLECKGKERKMTREEVRQMFQNNINEGFSTFLTEETTNVFNDIDPSSSVMLERCIENITNIAITNILNNSENYKGRKVVIVKDPNGTIKYCPNCCSHILTKDSCHCGYKCFPVDKIEKIGFYE